MSNQIVRSDMSTQQVGAALAKSGYFEDAKSEAQAIVKVLAGQELGFGPIASMTGIHVIKGKIAVGANLMAAAVKRSGKYNYRVLELTDTVCELVFFEAGQEVGRSKFTAADAAKAQTQNMNKFPKNMLFARAMSNGVKWYTPDVFLGAPVYTPEELGATIDEDDNVLSMPAERGRPAPTVRTVDQPADGAVFTIENEEQRQPREADDLAVCKSCGATIAWAKTKNGKNCPYDVDDQGVRSDISHFETCPNASEHSKAAPPKLMTPTEITAAWRELEAAGVKVSSAMWATDLETLPEDRTRDAMAWIARKRAEVAAR